MLILGIETSCDETAVAIYEASQHNGKGAILAERIASQIDIHVKFGGVVPEVASRAHLEILPGMVDSVMAEATTAWKNIDAIAVTAGPGLMGALLVGVSYAKAAGMINDIPVIPVHHMEGHLLAPGLSGAGLPPFPFITLLVSGGHTMLVRADAIGQYSIVGQTLDDAAGECFDKSARLLNLPYPGGPEIARLAQHGNPNRFKLPRPLLRRDNTNFSFSGLKTAVVHLVRQNPDWETDAQLKYDIAAGIETAITDILAQKSIQACLKEKVSNLVIAGGVAANQQLRAKLGKLVAQHHITCHLPEIKYCTDNAAMIAFCGSQTARAKKPIVTNWDCRARWPLTQLESGLPDVPA